MTTTTDSAALTRLRTMLEDGTTVYCIVRHVARSGMCRWIDLYVIAGGDGVPRHMAWIGRNAAEVTGRKWSKKHRGIYMPGCGYDACRELVDDVAKELGVTLEKDTL